MGVPAHGADRQQALVEEQAALRRVATLVAGGAPSAEVFDSVAQEVAQVLNLSNAAVCRYDEHGTVMTVLAVRGDHPPSFEAGSRWPLDGTSISVQILRTGRPARVEDYTSLPGALADEARKYGYDKVAGAPIIVDGRVWGAIMTSSPGPPLPDQLEDRLAEFTELVATAIANSQAHEELARLAEEQAALRRVATVAAEGASPADVFKAVSIEVAQLLPAEGSALTRFGDDGTVTALGGWTRDGGYVYVGTAYPLEGTVSGRVLESGRPERIDDYASTPGEAGAAARAMGWRSAVGAPITVEGRLWGVLAVSSLQDTPLPPDTETRLAGFTDLVATAIANADSREELAWLAEEQAALRRVATLVAEGAQPAEVFQAVSAAAGQLIPASAAGLIRYGSEGTGTVLGAWTRSGGFRVHAGDEIRLDRNTAARAVFETGRPARINGSDVETGRSSVGAPIVVDGRCWGVLTVAATREEQLPPDTEARLTQFAGLLATAVANAETRAELEASRARIVATADATRRRIERDLHDGAQQQLLALALDLRAAQADTPPELRDRRAELSKVAEGLTRVLDELREIALGIHPAILAEGGLSPALKTLAHRAPLPVTLDVQVDRRLPEAVEVAAYYVVSEALTNTAKHAEASTVRVAVHARDGVLHVDVRDDGIGGADPSHGSGLLGLKDRAEAIGGTMHVSSPRDGGTALAVELPLAGAP